LYETRQVFALDSVFGRSFLDWYSAFAIRAGDSLLHYRLFAIVGGIHLLVQDTLVILGLKNPLRCLLDELEAVALPRRVGGVFAHRSCPADEAVLARRQKDV
jgi:hypothetical protein